MLELPQGSRICCKLIAELSKVQQRTSGPHRGGIPFARGSLFHLLKNPVYRGKIVHKAQAYDGEHEPIVDDDLWEAVQAQLNKKAPPRKRPTNDPQRALLGGLLADPHGRQMVATYATKRSRRYAYYETRKDQARPGDPLSTRIGQGVLDRHIIDHLTRLLEDEHALRRMANLDAADRLRSLFSQALELRARLESINETQAALRSLIALIKVQRDSLELTFKPQALGLDGQACWSLSISLPARKPFGEAKLRLDAAETANPFDPQLFELLVEAQDVQRLVIGSSELSLNQLAKREGRCRKQLAKLLRLSWLSPAIVEAIASGTQPRAVNRTSLLEVELPIDWSEQELRFGFAG